jgi:hypothetical protein
LIYEGDDLISNALVASESYLLENKPFSGDASSESSSRIGVS